MKIQGTQVCSYCNKARRLLFQLLENKSLGAVERLVCCVCLQNEVHKERMALEKEIEAAPTTPPPPPKAP
jgi:glutaredoxin